MAVMTTSFPTVAEGYDPETVDAAFGAERAWRRALEERAEVLLREAAALHLAIAAHAVEPVDEPARLIAAEVDEKAARAPRTRKTPAVEVAAEPTAEEKHQAAAERRKAAAAAKKDAALAEELKARQAQAKREAAAERRRAAAAAKKEAALAEELKVRQEQEKREAAAERRKAAAAAKKAEALADATEAAVREEIARATAEVAAMKEELERMKALHTAQTTAVPAQSEITQIPPAAAAFAASAGAAWSRRTSESTTIRKVDADKPRPARAPVAPIAPSAVTVPLIPAAPVVKDALIDIEAPKQELPAARNGGRFSTKRIVLRKPVTATDEPQTEAPADRTPVAVGSIPLLTPTAPGGRVESRVIRLG